MAVCDLPGGRAAILAAEPSRPELSHLANRVLSLQIESKIAPELAQARHVIRSTLDVLPDEWFARTQALAPGARVWAPGARARTRARLSA